MSKIDDLISPPVEVTFRGEKFNLESGFTLEETPAIQMAFAKNVPEVKAEGMKLLLKVIVRRLYPSATEKEISKVDATYTPDLLEVFFQLDKTEKDEVKDVKDILSNKK